MEEIHRKKRKGITAFYSIVALMYLGIGGMSLSVLRPSGYKELIQGLQIMSDLLFVIAAVFLVNLLLAIGSWRVFKLSPGGNKFLLIGAIGVAIICFAMDAGGWWKWFIGTTPKDMGWSAQAAGLFLTVGYILSAYRLVHIVQTSNKLSEPTP